MKRRKSSVLAGIIVLALVLFLPVASWAYLFNVDFTGTGSGGTIAYAGGLAPLVGSDIPIHYVYGEIWDDNMNVLYSSKWNNDDLPFTINARLDFTTGASIGGWTWGPGSSNSITITDNDTSTQLLYGHLDSSEVSITGTIRFGGRTYSTMMFNTGSFSDSKDLGLLEWIFGDSEYFVPGVDGWTGSFWVDFKVGGSLQEGSAFNSTNVGSVDVTNSIAAVPARAEPAARLRDS